MYDNRLLEKLIVLNESSSLSSKCTALLFLLPGELQKHSAKIQSISVFCILSHTETENLSRPGNVKSTIE